MLALIESTAAAGSIELIYTRRPNAYQSYACEGDTMAIGLVKDPVAGIVAQAACTVRSYWINGEPHTAGYVSGVRRKAGYPGRIPWDEVAALTQQIPCDLFYCSFLSDNAKALDIFTRRRRFLPELVPLSTYTTHIINPKVIPPPRPTGHAPSGTRFRSIQPQDLPAVHRFLQREARRYQFAPVVTDLLREYPGLTLDDCYLLEDQGEILAFGALWDQRAYKQYIVTRYRRLMQLFRTLAPLFELLGYIAMPRAGKPLAFPTLTLFFARDQDPDLYQQFLHQIAQVIRRRYKMFVIGLGDRDPQRGIYNSLRTIHFESQLYVARHDLDLVLDPGRPVHLECGLL